MSDTTTVVLAAHGGGDASESNAAVRRLAARLATGRPDLMVAPAFHVGHPGFGEVAARLRDGDVIVPLLAGEGHYHGRLVAGLRTDDRTRPPALRLTRPVGSLPGLQARAIGRVAQARRRHAGGEPVAIVVMGHGTERDDRSGASEAVLAERLQHACSGTEVLLGYLDQAPRLDSLRLPADTRLVVVVPWFFGGGTHARRDVAAAVDALIERSGLTPPPARELLPPFGEDPDLIVALLREVDAHLPTRVYRIGTRGSRLALYQAHRVAGALAAAGVRIEVVPFTPEADRDWSRPLDAFAGEPFVAELEEALLAGTIDLAVHSFKDMDPGPPVGTGIAAVLPRGPAGEVLVTRGGQRLAELPAGATVGTSSTRRRWQILALRPDLQTVPVRGSVEARWQAVESGELGAVVLAEAGLVRLGEGDRIAERFPIAQLVPAPAQGAIVVTARLDDHAAREVVRPLHDHDTALAVSLEREIAHRARDRRSDTIVAAHATVDNGVRLHARLINPVTGVWHDLTCNAADGAVALAEVDRGMVEVLDHVDRRPT